MGETEAEEATLAEVEAEHLKLGCLWFLVTCLILALNRHCIALSSGLLCS